MLATALPAQMPTIKIPSTKIPPAKILSAKTLVIKALATKMQTGLTEGAAAYQSQITIRKRWQKLC